MSRPANDREGLSPLPPNLLDLFEGDEDDDDMYEPGTGESSTTGETVEESGSEYADASESLASLGNIEMVFEEDPDGAELEEEGNQQEEENAGEQTETETTTRPTTRYYQATIDDINLLLSTNGPLRRLLIQRAQAHGGGLSRLLQVVDNDDDIDDDSDDDYSSSDYPLRRNRQPRRKPKPVGDRFPKVPSDAGRTLMDARTFGCNDNHVDLRRRRKRTLSERLMWRRMGLDARPSMCKQNRLIAQDLTPFSTIPDRTIHYDSRAYSGQFSDDGNFFFSCTQNFKVRMYDTSNPYDWKYYKTVDYPYGQWTITDATLSPDNKYLAYTSIRHLVCLAPTDPTDDSEHTLLDLTNFAPGMTSGRPLRGNNYMGPNSFGIWSLRFSGDGREVVAGTSEHSVIVYDLERRQSTVRLTQHEDDVNAVCFGDRSSPHILYSGSDDQTLRVWDRRSMADGRPAGIFVGHTEGLTYVDSKGDGRYVISNGKDQLMKLWDLRRMVSPHDFSQMSLHLYTRGFDYRFKPYDENKYVPNPDDCSVVTFRGHSVLRTLIRCHFSPPGSSSSRYVYSGSEDGKVYVWNMDATIKAKIDVRQGTTNTRPRSNGGDGYAYDYSYHGSGWKTCVRDASWSPTAPLLAATSWNGWGMTTGTVTVHSWNDDAEEDEATPVMGTNYDARLGVRDDYNIPQRERRSRESGRGLRSTVVRPQRFGDGTATDDLESGGTGRW